MIPTDPNLEKHYISVEQKDLILAFVKERYGLDLTEYSEASVRRRITKLMTQFGLPDVEHLQEYLLSCDDGKAFFLEHFTVNVTEMFRDPSFYKALITHVFPVFTEKERVRIWCAGCSSGEEILSLNILLEENRLLDQCEILGTDINPQMLKLAGGLTYKERHVTTYLEPYRNAGGQYGLDKYFSRRGENVIFPEDLLRNVKLMEWDLQHQPPYRNFDLIICRNVMIYFTGMLQNKVFGNLRNALETGGFLGLGSKESIVFYQDKDKFTTIDLENRIYQKAG